MFWPNYLSVILPAAFSTIHALNLPTPLNQTVEFPSQLTSSWGCAHEPFGDAPLYTDCEVLYRQLPQSIDQATFHQKGEHDEYRLPVDRSYNTCMLAITLLIEGLQDRSSWAEIAFRAEMLNDMCVNGTNDGGYVKTGERGMILVLLMGVIPAENRTLGGQVDVT